MITKDNENTGSPEYQSLYSMVSDIGKDALGIRPRWHFGATMAELRQLVESYSRQITEEIEREEREKLARIARKAAETQKLANIRRRAFKRSPWRIGNFFDNSLALRLAK